MEMVVIFFYYRCSLIEDFHTMQIPSWVRDVNNTHGHRIREVVYLFYIQFESVVRE